MRNRILLNQHADGTENWIISFESSSS